MPTQPEQPQRPGLRANPDHSDQTGIFNPAEFGHTLTVIGCGGIGASALPTFASLGIPKIVLWDPDVVEPRNMASQLIYGPEDLLQPKVDVCKRELERLGVQEVEVHQKEFTADDADTLEGIVVCGVDTMAVRKIIWGAVEWNTQVALYMDGRIGGEQFTLLTVEPFNPDHIDWFTSFQLYDDEDTDPLPCAERAIIYPAVTLGAMMTTHITRHQRGEVPERSVYMNMRTLDMVKMT
jgi:hypothetical protein